MAEEVPQHFVEQLLNTDTTCDQLQLHIRECTNSHTDIERMRQITLEDPEALNRFQKPSRDFFPSFFSPTVNHSPLHDAAMRNHTRCVRFLLKSGADPNVICAENQETPLESAISSPFNLREPVEVVQMLLRAGASPNVTWKNDNTARTALLNKAVEFSNHKILKLLLEYGADLEHLTTNESGEVLPQPVFIDTEEPAQHTPLQSAIFKENIDAMKLLFLHGNNMNFSYKFINPMFSNEINSVVHFLVFRVEAVYENPDPIELEMLDLTMPELMDRVSKVLEMYKICGGDMWKKDKDPNAPEDSPEENILDTFKRRPQLVTKLSPLSDKIIELMPKPLELSEQCRVVIQKSIGRNYWKSTDKLELPKSLEQFLRLDDANQ